MIARLPPNALVKPGRLHDAADRELLLALDGAERQTRCRPRARSCSANSFVSDDRIGLRQEHQRIVDDRLVAAFEVVVAQAAIAGHVDAEDQQVALPRRCCESTTASMTGTATRTVGAAWTFSSTSSSKPVSPAVTCSSVLPAMRSTVLRERERARSDWRCACRRTRRRRARCRRSSAASAGRACGSTAS